MQSLVRLVIGTVAVVAVVGSPTAAFAQIGERSYRGLFSGSGHDPDLRHSLEFGGTVTEGYDDDAPGQFVGSPSDFLVSGFSTILEGHAQYRWRGERFEFGTTGASVLRYFNEFDNFRSSTHTGAIGFSAKLSAANELFFNQAVAYSPSYLYSLFPVDPFVDPGEAPPAGEDFQVVDSVSMTYNTDLRLTHSLSARNMLAGSANYAYTDFRDDEPVAGQPIYSDLRSMGARVDFTRNFNRRLSMVAGYLYRQGDYAFSTGGDTTEHGFEGGLDYKRTLSRSRSTFVGFRLGSSSLSGADIQSGGVTLFSGAVNGGYQFGRSWTARGNYRRGIDYVAGFSSPVVSDGLTVGVDGSIASNLELFTSFGYSNGDSALFEQAFPFNTYTGQVTLRYGMTKTIALTLEYLYYYYQFEDDAPLPVGIPTGLERNGVRAGLSVWVPAFRK